MGRKKGTKLSDEQKRKMREGRIAKKFEVKKPVAPSIITLYTTGNENTGFDYWPILRSTLRPLGEFVLCHRIEQEIVNPQIWKNNGIILGLLKKYFDVQVKESGK